jgi:predicted aspartyl protease
VAQLEVTLADDLPMIPVTIDGHEAQMLVDTGSAKSVILRSAAKELNLNIQSSNATFYGAGGSDTAGIVWVHDFTLASATIHKIPLYATGHVTLPGKGVGILGEDFLSKFDVEFDLSSGKIRLFTPRNCAADEVVYWAQAFFMTKLNHAPQNTGWVESEVSPDGSNIVAMFDTGASVSTVTTQALRQAGIHPESPVSAGVSKGLAAAPISSTAAVFPTLIIGQETIQNATLLIEDLFGKDTEVRLGSHIRQQVINEPDMIIGMDFFLAHRIFVARSQGKVYFTYQGGPIFRPISPQASVPAVARPTGDSATVDP